MDRLRGRHEVPLIEEKRFTTYEYVETVELMLKGKEEITSKEIGDLVMKYLKRLNRIAYIRFASVFEEFEEPEDFRRLTLEVKK
jgi:transcriptional repressor NrdR